MAFLWRKKDAKGLLSVFRVMKDTRNVRDRPLENLWGGGRGAGEVQKKYTRKGKSNEKKYSCYGLKKNSYKEFNNKKKIPAARKPPSPPPPIIFLMVRPLL